METGRLRAARAGGAAAEFGNLAQPRDLARHVYLCDGFAVQGIDDALGQPDRGQGDDLVVIVHGHVKTASRVHRPVPMRFSRKRRTEAAPHLVLYLDDQMLEQVRDLGRFRFPPERETVVVITALGRHMRQQLEQQAGQAWGIAGRVSVGLRDLHDQLGAAAAQENDFRDFQSVSWILPIQNVDMPIVFGYNSQACIPR